MFEEKTYENLLDEKLDRVPDKYDKREGSVIFDALAPNSMEDANIYITLEWLYRQMHGETADREDLVQIAKDTRGIVPKPATPAILKAVFDCPVEIGTKLSHEDVNYIVTERLDSAGNCYKLECEVAGETGNQYLGDLIPVEYIPNLTSAKMTEILVYGSEEEDTESFRERWRQSFNSTEFGGNKASYIKAIKDINGVGGVKVERATNEDGERKGGYVRCTVLSSKYDVPSDELIDEIQTIIDPEVNHGEGDGLAPIGAVAYIRPVGSVVINISTTILFDNGYSFESLKDDIQSAVDAYFLEICKEWEENGTRISQVRKAKIESAILNIDGVIDIKDTLLNGSTENVTIDAYSIPIRGEIIEQETN